MVIWEIQVSVKDLELTGPAITRHGFKDQLISMSAIVPWEVMGQSENLAKGPGKEFLNYKIAWTTCLKVFIEVKIFHLNGFLSLFYRYLCLLLELEMIVFQVKAHLMIREGVATLLDSANMEMIGWERASRVNKIR